MSQPTFRSFVSGIFFTIAGSEGDRFLESPMAQVLFLPAFDSILRLTPLETLQKQSVKSMIISLFSLSITSVEDVIGILRYKSVENHSSPDVVRCYENLFIRQTEEFLCNRCPARSVLEGKHPQPSLKRATMLLHALTGQSQLSIHNEKIEV